MKLEDIKQEFPKMPEDMRAMVEREVEKQMKQTDRQQTNKRKKKYTGPQDGQPPLHSLQPPHLAQRYLQASNYTGCTAKNREIMVWSQKLNSRLTQKTPYRKLFQL